MKEKDAEDSGERVDSRYKACKEGGRGGGGESLIRQTSTLSHKKKKRQHKISSDFVTVHCKAASNLMEETGCYWNRSLKPKVLEILEYTTS